MSGTWNKFRIFVDDHLFLHSICHHHFGILSWLLCFLMFQFWFHYCADSSCLLTIRIIYSKIYKLKTNKKMSYTAWMVSKTSMSLLNVCDKIFLMPSLTLSMLSTPSTSLLTNSDSAKWLQFPRSIFSAADSRPNAFARSNNDDLLAALSGAY